MAIGMIAGLSSNNNNNNNDNDLKLTLNENFISLNRNKSTTITVNTPSDGKIYATSSDTNIVTVSVSNNIINITAIQNYGSAIIYIGQDKGTGTYANTMPKIIQLFVLIPLADSILENNSWTVISEVSQTGTGNLYWSIGDTKSITLNGTIGTLSLSNFACKVFILHFNYSMNGVADNNIIWGGFKDSNGKDIALVDSNYRNTSTDGTMYFSMNHWGNTSYYGSNFGGWKGCCLRYDILGATSTAPSQYGTIYTSTNVGYDATSATLISPKAGTLLAALPTDFRHSLRLWSRWIDAVGNKSNVDVNIKETIDAVTLLAEFEVRGTREYANEYEQNHQSQMEYYKLGNSLTKTRYKHNDSSSRCTWWFATPCYSNGIRFSFTDCANVYPAFGSTYAYYSYSVAPAFKT